MKTKKKKLNIQKKIENAIEKALSNAKARNIKAVKALLDLKDAKLNKVKVIFYAQY